MIKTESFFIEVLDDGYVMSNGNKNRAIQTRKRLEEILVEKLMDLIGPLNRLSTHNMVINFDVDVNVPRADRENLNLKTAQATDTCK